MSALQAWCRGAPGHARLPLEKAGRTRCRVRRGRAPPDLKRRSRKDLGPVALRVNAMSSEASERRRSAKNAGTAGGEGRKTQVV